MTPQALLLAQTVVSGLLVGLMFSLIAVGLALIYGVMGLVNFAHGDLLMLSMYAAFWLHKLFSLDPLLSLPLCTLLLFLLGITIYRLVVKRILDAPKISQIFATFGLVVFFRNLAHFLWSPDYRLIREPFLRGRLEVFGIYVSIPQLVASIGAVVASGFIYWFVMKTEIGRALRATAEDKEAAALMGINSDRMYALAWGMGAACVGVAGALLSNFYFVFPEVGAIFGLTALMIVVLGGLGSIPGAFTAGIIVGLVQVLGGYFIAPAFKMVVVFLIYLVIVILRPQGLFGKW